MQPAMAAAPPPPASASAAPAAGEAPSGPPPPKHESYRAPDVPRRIKQIRFGLMSPDEIVRTSELQVFERQLYNIPDRKPAPNGVLDPRLGVSSKGPACATCGGSLADCAGHFGHIRLALPVFHIGYFKATLHALQCVCKTCSRLLLPPEERARAMRAIRGSGSSSSSEKAADAPAERAPRAAALKRAADRCRRVRSCPHCGAANGPVKKVPGSLKISHERFSGRHMGEALAAYASEFADAAAALGGGGGRESGGGGGMSGGGSAAAAASALAAANGEEPAAPGSSSVPSPQAAGTTTTAAGTTSHASASLEAGLRRLADDLHPLRAAALLSAVPDADAELLGLAGRPEHLLLTHLPVPPVCIRPSVEVDGGAGAGTNEDDVTMKLMTLIDVNNIVGRALSDGAHVASLLEHWDFLQVQAAMYINSELPGLPPAYHAGGGGSGGPGGGGGGGGGPGGGGGGGGGGSSAKPLRGFVQRLKGKQGRFRGNLSGKRVDFSARTVISPDPNLGVAEVGVPRCVATTLTYPERVTAHNVDSLRARVLAGASRWPGANFVRFPDGGRWFLKYGDRRRIAANLAPGDVVERHLADGDVVLFNRQPSLHRLSLMAHCVRVLPGRTFRLNECVCAPYNADFDGDEMNVHVPQTEEARAEARELMAVGANLATPKNGELAVAATQDFLTAAHLLTSRDSWFPRSGFAQLCAHATGGAEAVDLPVPALLKPVERWSGKQLFSVLVSPSAAAAAAAASSGFGASVSSSAAAAAASSSSSHGKNGSGGVGGARCGEDGGDSWGSAVAGAPPGDGDGGNPASSSSSPNHSDDARRFAAADAAAAVNLCLTERTHASGTGALCPNDGFVLFRDSRLLLGRLGKGTLGGGGKGGLFAALASGAGGAPAAAAAMRRLAALAARWIGERGLSVGIGDVTPAPGLEGAKRAALVEAYARAEAVAEAAALASSCASGGGETGSGVKDGENSTSSRSSDQPPESAASRDARAALEAAAAAALNGVREGVSRLCMAGLGRHNAPLLMSQCGAKGSPINIAQMVGCVGQQSVGGARPPDGFRGRALPAFARGDGRPAARGFVASSFYEGLGPAEFFFHAMAGREGLVDTAVKTAETGYMSRRLMKALEDLFVAYDGTVRNAAGAVVALSYGDDGLEPGTMEGAGSGDSGGGSGDTEAPLDLGRLLDGVRAARARRERAARRSSHPSAAAAAPAAAPPPLAPLPAELSRAADEAVALFVTVFEEGEGGSGGRQRAAAAKRAADAAAAGSGSGAPPRPSVLITASGHAIDLPVPVSQRFRDGLSSFLVGVAARAGGLRERLGAPRDSRAEEVENGPLSSAELACSLCSDTTPADVSALVAAAAARYEAKRVSPGGTVGAVGAQSIGEPGTQMTLKTFHFAGVAAMNVTLGVPRVKEIINAARAISTPIIEVALEDDRESGARRVQEALQRTTLAEVAESVEAVVGSRGAAYIRIRLRRDNEEEEEEEEDGEEMEAEGAGGAGARKKSKKNATRGIPSPPASAVAAALIAAPKLRLKEEHVRVVDHGRKRREGGKKSGRGSGSSSGGGGGEIWVFPPEERDPASGTARRGSAAASAVAGEAAAAEKEAFFEGGNGSGSGRARSSSAGPTRRASSSRGVSPALTAAANASTPSTLFLLHALLRALPAAVVGGVASVERAVLTRKQAEKKGKGKKNNNGDDDDDEGDAATNDRCVLTVEGRDLGAVLSAPGVDGTRTTTNHVMEVERVLGIEAARASLAAEVASTMGAHGMSVDARHNMLLADCMTYKGEVLGITRFGIAKMKDSVLMLASFEKTTDHLFDAALRGAADPVRGVSECIIMGMPMAPGTGLFKLIAAPGGGVGVGGGGSGKGESNSDDNDNDNDLSQPPRPPPHLLASASLPPLPPPPVFAAYSPAAAAAAMAVSA